MEDDLLHQKQKETKDKTQVLILLFLDNNLPLSNDSCPGRSSPWDSSTLISTTNPIVSPYSANSNLKFFL